MFSGLALLSVARKAALGLPRAHRSIWFHGAAPEQFCAAEKLIRDIRAQAPHQQFVFTSFHSATLAWLKARFPTDWMLLMPWGQTSILRRFFRALRRQLIIWLDSPASLGGPALRCAAEAQVPVVVINMRHAEDLITDPLLGLRLVDSPISQICVPDARTAAVLRDRGFSPDHITITGAMDFEFAPPTQNASQEYLRHELRLPSQALVILAEKITPAEETLMLEFVRQLRESHPQVVLCVELRHNRQLRRFGAMCRDAKLPVERRSRRSEQIPPAVVLLDQPGELSGLYGVA